VSEGPNDPTLIQHKYPWHLLGIIFWPQSRQVSLECCAHPRDDYHGADKLQAFTAPKREGAVQLALGVTDPQHVCHAKPRKKLGRSLCGAHVDKEDSGTLGFNLRA